MKTQIAPGVMDRNRPLNRFSFLRVRPKYQAALGTEQVLVRWIV